jgi:ABC-type antimicrobial peptide transport system permease subunit
MYVPLAQHYQPNLAFVARSQAAPGAAVRVIEGGASARGYRHRRGSDRPRNVLLARSYFAARIAAGIAGMLGLVTLLMAVVGLYGVQLTSWRVGVREIGVRMALGASTSPIVNLILRDALRPVLEGICLATVLAIVARFVLRATIGVGVHRLDALAFALIPIAFVAAALVASYFPARRAAHVDPNVALRYN